MTVFAIHKVSRHSQTPFKSVRCPICGSGRICDVGRDVHIKNAGESSPDETSGTLIYVKCPRCGKLVGITV